MIVDPVIAAIPRALDSYPSVPGQSLAADLLTRVQLEPFNAVATAIFLLAILHSFAAARFAALADRCSTATTTDGWPTACPPGRASPQSSRIPW